LPEGAASGRSGFRPAPGTDDEDGGFFEEVFGWIFDFFEQIFGAGSDVAGVEDGPTDVVESAPDSEPEPAPALVDDIVLIEYIPALMVEEEGEIHDHEDDEPGMHGDFVFVV
jgi:hypothetical protein